MTTVFQSRSFGGVDFNPLNPMNLVYQIKDVFYEPFKPFLPSCLFQIQGTWNACWVSRTFMNLMTTDALTNHHAFDDKVGEGSL